MTYVLHLSYKEYITIKKDNIMKHINHIVIIAGILLTCADTYSMKALQRLPKNTHRKPTPKKVHYRSNTSKKKKAEYRNELRRLNNQHEVIFRYYQSSAGLFEGDPE